MNTPSTTPRRMRTLRLVFLLFITIVPAALLTGCDTFQLDEGVDPNGLSLDALEDPDLDEIGNLVAGTESAMRTDINLYLTDVGVIGREYYRFSASEPRFTSELLGFENAVLDNNTFYLTRPWNERYRAIRNANFLLDAVERVDDDAILDESEKAEVRGIAKTFIAYQLLLNLNLTYFNGIRVDVAGDEPGDFVGYDQALSDIRALLDEANSDLSQGSGALPVALSDGFNDFATAEGFAQINRGLAARVALYQGNTTDALAILDDSFIDATASTDVLRQGAYHTFSTDPVDIVNPYFFPPDNPGEVLAAHPGFVDDIEEGDERIEKVVLRSSPFSRVGLESDYSVFVYDTQLSPIPIVRNAELVLIRAEANIAEGEFGAAADDLNVIRNAAGLDDYAGPLTEDALMDELLFQRRYELYAEGHRWIDVRRILGDDCPDDNQATCLNDDLPIDREGDNVWLQFPIPAQENVGE